MEILQASSNRFRIALNNNPTYSFWNFANNIYQNKHTYFAFTYYNRQPTTLTSIEGNVIKYYVNYENIEYTEDLIAYNVGWGWNHNVLFI